MKKMITQLLLSLSIFSFVFSCYSLCSSSQSHPRKLSCLSANPFMNLQYYSSHAVNKNYIFLICNAILVFLSKTSGLVRSSSGFDLNEMLQKRVGDGVLLLQTYSNFATNELSFLQRPQEEDEEGERILDEETKDHQISMESDEEYLRGICDDHNFEADADKIHEEDSTENCSLAVDGMIEEEEEEEESMDQQEVAEEEVLSTEELNKKFEEFIRKTKEEIMMNEFRQLVIVK